MNKENLAQIKAIFFDTSDTLYKNAELEAAYPEKLTELLAEKLHIPNTEAKQQLKDATERLKATEKHVTKVRAAAEFGLTRDEVHEKAFCKVVPSQYLSEDKPLAEAIHALSSKYKLGIISNLKKSHMLEVLNALGLSPSWFPYFVTEDLVHEIKPAHEPFLKAIELAGCQPAECLYIGDSPTKDMRPAKEVGMKTVLVATNPSSEDLVNADYTVTTVLELDNLLPKFSGL